MNEVFFACASCRILVDAGYRWATSTLERSGVVARGALVDAPRVLHFSEYWSPPGAESELLTDEILPRVRLFFDAHADHEVVFGDAEEIMGVDDLAFLDWLDVSGDPQVGPRHLVEVLRLPLWVDAVAWIRGQPHQPWWWGDADLMDAVRRRFLEFLEERRADGVPPAD